MKLVVIIPAYNEEKSINQVIGRVPRQIAGIEQVYILVINDGSQDRTVEIARSAGADLIINNETNLGLARTFKKGILAALDQGADIIVNLDADNQYNPQEIPKLIQPIIDGQAEIVTGDRQIKKLKYLSWSNKYGNLLGSWLLRRLTGFNITDVSSGFRAYSAAAVFGLNILSIHTYTHETLISAWYKRIKISQVPVEFHPRQGKSRLISSLPDHIKKSLITILRTMLHHKPLKTFLLIGSIVTLFGVLLGARFLYFYFTEGSGGHIQSLILTAILISVGFTTIVMGLLADLIRTNREISEEILSQLKEKDFKNKRNE